LTGKTNRRLLNEREKNEYSHLSNRNEGIKWFQFKFWCSWRDEKEKCILMKFYILKNDKISSF